MAKNYIPIESFQRLGESGRIIIDTYRIKQLLGVAGECVQSTAVYFKSKMNKFAFFNTGELCEAQFTDGNAVLCVRCHGIARRKEVLGWLKQYLTNGMKSLGYETEISEDKDDYFYARFYKEEK